MALVDTVLANLPPADEGSVTVDALRALLAPGLGPDEDVAVALAELVLAGDVVPVENGFGKVVDKPAPKASSSPIKK